MIAETERTLKDEADRLHREIVRRLPEPSSLWTFVREHTAAFVVTVAGGIVSVLILVYVFGIRG